LLHFSGSLEGGLDMKKLLTLLALGIFLVSCGKSEIEMKKAKHKEYVDDSMNMVDQLAPLRGNISKIFGTPSSRNVLFKDMPAYSEYQIQRVGNRLPTELLVNLHNVRGDLVKFLFKYKDRPEKEFFTYLIFRYLSLSLEGSIKYYEQFNENYGRRTDASNSSNSSNSLFLGTYMGEVINYYDLLSDTKTVNKRWLLTLKEVEEEGELKQEVEKAIINRNKL
jgi:hypothetical protein